jgi:EAL domain-containing protein (putative c-di-GMP-specific phosphodiesterase class I)
LLLQDAVGDRGVVARLGSDEFGVIVKNSSLEDSIDLANECIANIHEQGFKWADKNIAISMSAGLVPINAQSMGHENIMQEAEASCRVAKEIGGNRVQLYHADHTRLSKRSESIKWAAKVDEVIERGGFSLRAQRIVPVAYEAEDYAHYEILLNVFDTDGSPLPLDDFIHAAEVYNRMQAVDRWVITAAFNWITENEDYLGDISTFSINLSGRSVNDEDFADFLEEQIATSGVPTEYLCFEITETAGIENLSTAAEFINRIKESGCRFSLDDFGSGQSSYGYLKKLPVDYLKIDGMFVRDMANNDSDFAVVKSITEIGHFMGKYVIAEFVENQACLDLLREIGVDFAQGYGVEKPVMLNQLLS